jgi:hypothetical protein
MPILVMTRELHPSILNEAMRSHVHTFTQQDRLDSFIDSRGLGEYRAEIKKRLDALLRTAEDYLYNYPNGVPWDDDIKRDYIALLGSEHPWVDQESIDCVLSFSGWLCWHEGLNRTPKA